MDYTIDNEFGCTTYSLVKAAIIIGVQHSTLFNYLVDNGCLERNRCNVFVPCVKYEGSPFFQITEAFNTDGDMIPLDTRITQQGLEFFSKIIS